MEEEEGEACGCCAEEADHPVVFVGESGGLSCGVSVVMS